ncbi:MAG: Gmad2 immunoglobulin-like domain-containing protein [Acidimicrobiia bacterium]
MPTRIIAASALIALVGACSATPAATTSTTAAPTTTVPAATTTPPLARCSEDFEFGEGGQIADLTQESSDSGTIGAMSWEAAEDCETFTIAFQTSEGAPATTPPSAQVLHLESFQVLRVRMLGVGATVITDQLVETQLVDRIYVVRSLEGGMFIDFHLTEPTQARVEAVASPARLILTMRPGLVPLNGFSTIGERVVVTSPPAGSTVDPFLTVSGYSRTFEANVLLIGTLGNEVVVERSTIAADWAETWGEFRSTINLPPGPVSLFVGESSAQDGALEGVTVSLTVR